VGNANKLHLLPEDDGHCIPHPINFSHRYALRGETGVIDQRTAPYAALLLRVSLGSLFLIHAGLKLFVFTPIGTAQFFASLGLPPSMGYFTIAWEICGGVTLILGLWARIAALCMIPDLLGAIALVHAHAGFFFFRRYITLDSTTGGTQ
jgi:putative oxidoreductase